MRWRVCNETETRRSIPGYTSFLEVSEMGNGIPSAARQPDRSPGTFGRLRSGERLLSTLDHLKQKTRRLDGRREGVRAGANQRIGDASKESGSLEGWRGGGGTGEEQTGPLFYYLPGAYEGSGLKLFSEPRGNKTVPGEYSLTGENTRRIGKRKGFIMKWGMTASVGGDKSGK